MTRLALGENCGARGASGLTFLALVAPTAFSESSNEASAIEPNPTPHCRKNQRRVINLAYSERSSFVMFMIENSKFEIRNSKQTRRSKFELGGGPCVRSWFSPNRAKD